jgi:hypothetical protein
LCPFAGHEGIVRSCLEQKGLYLADWSRILR